ncbi:MAG: PAS domain S-box protein [Desulfobulbaceae bacterium]|jgi:histidine kinase|nr:PAS domain S-box protein [Desulfobulbaceae bacterium]
MVNLRNLSFSNKVLFSTTLIVVLLGIAVVSVVRWVLLPSLTSELQRRGVAVAQSIAAQSRGYILIRDEPMLTSLIFEEKQLEERRRFISYILVLDTEQTVLAHTFIGEFPAWVAEANVLPPDQARSIKPVKTPAGQIYDIAVPVKEGIYQIGTVRVGLNKTVIDMLIRKLTLVLLGAVTAFIVAGFFISHRLARYITRPVTQLTHLADEISRGNLDVPFDFGEPVKCWEIEECDKIDCPAYGETEIMCWFTEGTLCTGAPMGKFPDKLEECFKCRVYRRHAGDEVVQLADAFSNMTRNLKVSRDELRRVYDFQRSLIEGSIDGIVATNEKGSIVIFNEAAEKLFGYASAEVVGRMDMDDLYPPHRSREVMENLLGDEYGGAGKLVNYETTIANRAGSEVPVWLSASILHDQGKMLGTVMFLQDLTERRRLEMKVLESEKLATVGLVASYISHEIKNPLMVISGFANQVLRSTGQEGKNREKLEIIIREVNRLEGFLTEVCDFTKLSRPKKILAGVNDVLEEVCTLFEQEFEKGHVQLVKSMDPELPEIFIDPRQMKQVFINIIKNSVEAMPDGGQIIVETGLEDNGIAVRISDSGKGIAPGDMKDIFSPFVTTKPRGTGLGLAISRKIIEDHDGEVCVRSELGKGTICTIVLPVQGPG